MDVRAVFLFGDAKNDMDSLSDAAERDDREAGRLFLRASDEAILALLRDGILKEIER